MNRTVSNWCYRSGESDLPSYDVLIDNWTMVVVPRVICLPDLMRDRSCEKISSDLDHQNSNEPIWSHWRQWSYHIPQWHWRNQSRFPGQNCPKERKKSMRWVQSKKSIDEKIVRRMLSALEVDWSEKHWKEENHLCFNHHLKDMEWRWRCV